MLQCHAFLTSYCYRVIRVKCDSIPSTACSVVLTTIMLLRVGVIADPLYMTNECSQPFSPPAANGVNIITGGINSTIDARKTMFTSPFKSPCGYYDVKKYGSFPEARPLTREESVLKERGHAAINSALDIMFNKNGWTREIIDGLYLEDVVESKRASGTKIYRSQVTLNATINNLMAVLYDTFESEPNWNPTVINCNILESIGNNTQLVYIVSAPACDGMINSREFYAVRHRAAIENSLVIGVVSVEFLMVPENEDFIRGELGPSCYLLTPVPDQTNVCELRWLLNTDLRGRLPEESFDIVLKYLLKNYLSYLRAVILEISENALEELENQPDYST